jgi:rhomboid protease GluP
VAAISIFLVTGAVTTLQFPFTPLLVQSPPWQAVVTVPAVLALGIPVERRFGTGSTFALYLLPAAVGEAVGYAWQPHGAGNSIGDCGLLGALIAWVLLEGRGQAMPPLVRSMLQLWGGAVLVGAVVDTAYKDVHGLPTLTGALLGGAMLLRRRKRRGLRRG